MRSVFQGDWDGLYLRVREGDPAALVALKNQAIRLVARCRVARYSSAPPWLREELAEEAFDRTEPAFPRLETWARAFGYMRTTMDRLIFRAGALGERLLLEEVVERLVDPQPAVHMREIELMDSLFEIAGTLSRGRFRQLRALARDCWSGCDGRDAHAKEAGVGARTWSSERKDLLEHLRKRLGDFR